LKIRIDYNRKGPEGKSHLAATMGATEGHFGFFHSPIVAITLSQETTSWTSS